MDALHAAIDAVNGFILTSATGPWAYVLLFSLCLLDGFFPPVPSEAVVVGLAALVTGGGINFWLLLATAAAGAFAGDNIAFFLGRAAGASGHRRLHGRRLQRGLARTRQGLARSPVSLILTARFVPVGRVLVNMAAGATGFSGRRFAALAGVSASLWALYSVGIGLLAGSWFQENHLLAMAAATSLALLLGLGTDRLLAGLKGARRTLVPQR